MESSQSLQRVLDAFSLKVPDKIPFHAYESPENAVHQLGYKVHEIYLEPNLVPRAMVNTAKLYQNDVIYMRWDYFVPEGQEAVADEGGGLLFRDKKTREVVSRVPYDLKDEIPIKESPPPIRTVEDIKTAAPMKVTPWKELRHSPEYESLQIYVDEFKGKRFLFGFAGGQSANIIDRSLGTQNAMIAAMTDPGLCRAIMDRRYEQLQQMMLALKDVGADGIYSGDACASCSLYGAKLYNEMFFEYQKKSIDFAHAKGLKILLHICGSISPILEKMVETGADVIESIDCPSAGGDVELKDAKRRVGGQVCLKGNIDAVHTIEPGPPEVIYDACIEAMKDAGPDGYILSTEQITRDTPGDHVLAMVKARDDYSRSS